MGRPVYSTDQGRLCPECGQPVGQCVCKSKGSQRPSAGDGIVRLQRQTKGRKGKGVILVTGLDLPEAELKALAKELKQRCSTGGSVKNGIIEIQGDQRDLLQKVLRDKGFDVKLSGG